MIVDNEAIRHEFNGLKLVHRFVPRYRNTFAARRDNQISLFPQLRGGCEKRCEQFP